MATEVSLVVMLGGTTVRAYAGLLGAENIPCLDLISIQ